VRGLVINRFGVGSFGGGVWLGAGATGTLIEDNYIGTDVDGAVGLADDMRGISILSAGNVIKGNVISGSSERGVLIFSDNNLLLANRIGTNAAGTGAIPNNEGIEIQTARNIIGGARSPTETSSREHTDWCGYRAGANLLQTTTSTGNYIGLNASGRPIPNGNGISSRTTSTGPPPETLSEDPVPVSATSFPVTAA
jgi:hypothetical protein